MGKRRNRQSRAKSNLQKVRRYKWGYNISQVDEFLSKARQLYLQPRPSMSQQSLQTSSFDLQRGGYKISDVDGTLLQLEQDVSDKHTRWEVEYRGERGWMEETLGLVLTLKPRELAPLCKRFDGGKKKSISYDRQQVDQVMDDSWYTICRHLSLPTDTRLREPMSIDAIGVSDTIFTQRKGKKGYGEPSVDAYLNRVVQVLNRIESFKRLGYKMPDSSTVRPARRGFVERADPKGEKEKVHLQAPAEHASLSSLVSKSEEEKEETLVSKIPPSFSPEPSTQAALPSIKPPAAEEIDDKLQETKISPPRRRHARNKKFFGLIRRDSSSKGDEE